MLTQSAYARQKGVTKQYISQRVKAGAIQLVNGKIDPAQADAALAGAADPTRGPQVAANALRRGSAHSVPIPGVSPETEIDPPTQDGRYVTTPLSRAKTADAVFSAKQRQLDYEKAVGRLVESAEVVRAIAAMSTALTQLDGIPDRITARMLATDERGARALLVDELAEFRQAMADFCAALVERTGARTQ